MYHVFVNQTSILMGTSDSVERGRGCKAKGQERGVRHTKRAGVSPSVL